MSPHIFAAQCRKRKDKREFSPDREYQMRRGRFLRFTGSRSSAVSTVKMPKCKEQRLLLLRNEGHWLPMERAAPERPAPQPEEAQLPNGAYSVPLSICPSLSALVATSPHKPWNVAGSEPGKPSFELLTQQYLTHCPLPQPGTWMLRYVSSHHACEGNT
ncbi:uncharacterized protein LOC144303509 [Canis aureus]